MLTIFGPRVGLAECLGDGCYDTMALFAVGYVVAAILFVAVFIFLARRYFPRHWILIALGLVVVVILFQTTFLLGV